MKKFGKAMIMMLIAREWAQIIGGMLLCTHGVEYAQVKEGIEMTIDEIPAIKWIALNDLVLIRTGYKIRENIGDI